MNHVRRRLSSSINNVSNMRLDGAMGIPLQVQAKEAKNEWSDRFSLLRAEGFTCSLSVLYGGLGKSKLQFLIKKI
jgi:hypothetical protein